MMHLFHLSCLLVAAEVIAFAEGHDCAFIPGPITGSSDTLIATVDCHIHQHLDEIGLVNTTGNYTGLLVYLYNCITVPDGLFIDISANLSTVTVMSKDNKEQSLLRRTFEGLGEISELRLEGFQSLVYLNAAVFRPLKNLERLLLVGFGANKLKYGQLGSALSGLSGTHLRRIVMHRMHSANNIEKILDITALFPTPISSVREFIFSDNVVTGVYGRLSVLLPGLNYLCFGANVRYYIITTALFDVLFFLLHLHTFKMYSYPIQDRVISAYNPLNEDNFNSWYLGHPNCFNGILFPKSASLRRLTVRNFQLLPTIIDKPICFDSLNKIEFLDFAGSPLPTNTTRITGLHRLKYLDIQNTGIAELPYETLGYFPNLEGLNLGQLPIGDWVKRINSSLFGECPTLREIHLGDCQLTVIPSDTFSLLPSLQTLNLSSNSLRTFHVNLSSNSNFTHLNLSRNLLTTLSEVVLAVLNTIAQSRLQAGEFLTIDLRGNPSLSCLCNSTHFVSQLLRWVINKEANVPGFEEFRCFYPNGSIVAMSVIDIDQLEKQCSVINEITNGSDCPCDDDLRQRLKLVRLSLHGYVCRNSDGDLIPMTIHPLPDCPNFFKSAAFTAPVVTGATLALSVIVTVIVFYRYRKTKRVNRLLRGIRMSRIVRVGIQHVLRRNRGERNNFEHDVFLYIQDNDQEVAGHWFDAKLAPHRNVIRNDDFRAGLKLETQLEDIQSCRWLVPVLSQNFVDDGECCDFIARAQYTRPHALVPVAWTPFHTDDLTINNLLDTAEPVKWPGDEAADVEKLGFWTTLLERTVGSSAL